MLGRISSTRISLLYGLILAVCMSIISLGLVHGDILKPTTSLVDVSSSTPSVTSSFTVTCRDCSVGLRGFWTLREYPTELSGLTVASIQGNAYNSLSFEDVSSRTSLPNARAVPGASGYFTWPSSLDLTISVTITFNPLSNWSTWLDNNMGTNSTIPVDFYVYESYTTTDHYSPTHIIPRALVSQSSDPQYNSINFIQGNALGYHALDIEFTRGLPYNSTVIDHFNYFIDIELLGPSAAVLDTLGLYYNQTKSIDTSIFCWVDDIPVKGIKVDSTNLTDSISGYSQIIRIWPNQSFYSPSFIYAMETDLDRLGAIFTRSEFKLSCHDNGLFDVITPSDAYNSSNRKPNVKSLEPAWKVTFGQTDQDGRPHYFKTQLHPIKHHSIDVPAIPVFPGSVPAGKWNEPLLPRLFSRPMYEAFQLFSHANLDNTRKTCHFTVVANPIHYLFVGYSNSTFSYNSQNESGPIILSTRFSVLPHQYGLNIDPSQGDYIILKISPRLENTESLFSGTFWQWENYYLPSWTERYNNIPSGGTDGILINRNKLVNSLLSRFTPPDISKFWFNVVYDVSVIYEFSRARTLNDYTSDIWFPTSDMTAEYSIPRDCGIKVTNYVKLSTSSLSTDIIETSNTFYKRTYVERSRASPFIVASSSSNIYNNNTNKPSHTYATKAIYHHHSSITPHSIPSSLSSHTDVNHDTSMNILQAASSDLFDKFNIRWQLANPIPQSIFEYSYPIFSIEITDAIVAFSSKQSTIPEVPVYLYSESNTTRPNRIKANVSVQGSKLHFVFEPTSLEININASEYHFFETYLESRVQVTTNALWTYTDRASSIAASTTLWRDMETTSFLLRWVGSSSPTPMIIQHDSVDNRVTTIDTLQSHIGNDIHSTKQSVLFETVAQEYRSGANGGDSSDNNDSSTAGIIAGVVVGSIVILIIIITIICCCCRIGKSKTKKEEKTHDVEVVATTTTTTTVPVSNAVYVSPSSNQSSYRPVHSGAAPSTAVITTTPVIQQPTSPIAHSEAPMHQQAYHDPYSPYHPQQNGYSQPQHHPQPQQQYPQPQQQYPQPQQQYPQPQQQYPQPQQQYPSYPQQSTQSSVDPSSGDGKSKDLAPPPPAYDPSLDYSSAPPPSYDPHLNMGYNPYGV